MGQTLSKYNSRPAIFSQTPENFEATASVIYLIQVIGK